VRPQCARAAGDAPRFEMREEEISAKMNAPGVFLVEREDGVVVYAGVGKNAASECTAYAQRSARDEPLYVRFEELPKTARASVLKAKFKHAVQALGYVPVDNAPAASDKPAANEKKQFQFSPEQLQTLQNRGFVVLDDAFGKDEALAASAAARALFDRGVMQNLNQEGRDDDVAVLSTSQMPGGAAFDGLKYAATFLLDVPDALRRSLAVCDAGFIDRDFANKIANCASPSRMMVARYHSNAARYVSHLDNDPRDASNAAGEPTLRPCDRVFTCIAYLNPNWVPEHEGRFRAYDLDVASADQVDETRPDTRFADVDPLCGRVVVFDSARLLHEVRPSRAERFAMTVWTYDVRLAASAASAAA